MCVYSLSPLLFDGFIEFDVGVGSLHQINLPRPILCVCVCVFVCVCVCVRARARV